MIGISLYCHVHQPYRLRHTRMREIGSHPEYFDNVKNGEIFRKVASKCYWPAGRLFASLLRRYPNGFRINFSITGTFLSQCQKYDPELLEFYQELCSLPNVELVCETSHHTLVALRDFDEFAEEVINHQATLKKLFNKETKIFRNTELIYTNEIGKKVKELGFKGILLEGWDPVLPQGWSAHHLFHHPEFPDFKLIPKSYRLSDDIAFRFSNKAWNGWPLTAEKYHHWVRLLLDGTNEFVGLFMDYETFGEHQWADTGIFNFIEAWVSMVVHDPQFKFMTLSEAAEFFPARAPMWVNYPMSWADVERDITAWLGNGIQDSAFKKALELKPLVQATKSETILEEWRKLLTSDHFYYMCIKWSADGDVHKYFSPFDSPYDAYLDYMNILEDFEIKCKKIIADYERKEAAKHVPLMVGTPEQLLPETETDLVKEKSPQKDSQQVEFQKK